METIYTSSQEVETSVAQIVENDNPFSGESYDRTAYYDFNLFDDVPTDGSNVVTIEDQIRLDRVESSDIQEPPKSEVIEAEVIQVAAAEVAAVEVAAAEVAAAEVAAVEVAAVEVAAVEVEPHTLNNVEVDTSKAKNPAHQFLLDRGFAIFPCLPNAKRPATNNGCTEATNNLEDLRKLWQTNCNVGEANRSNLILLDVDNKPRKGIETSGNGTLRQLVKQFEKLPQTLAAVTPNNGYHFYFRRPDGMKVANAADKLLGAGLEVKAENQYLVAPPSVIDGKSYEFINDLPVADCPEWLAALTLKPIPEKSLPKTELVKAKPTYAESKDSNDKYTAINAKYDKENRIEDVLLRNGYSSDATGKFAYPGEKTASVLINADNSCQVFGAGDPLAGKGSGASSDHFYPWKAAIELEYNGNATDFYKAFFKTHPEYDEAKVSTSSQISSEVVPAATESNSIRAADWRIEERLFSDTKPQKIDWLSNNRIALGKCTIFGGEGGVNKSTVAYDLAARLSVGGKQPLSEEHFRVGRTLLISGDDDPSDVIRPRGCYGPMTSEPSLPSRMQAKAR